MGSGSFNNSLRITDDPGSVGETDLELVEVVAFLAEAESSGEIEGSEEDGLSECLIERHSSYLSSGTLYPSLYFTSKRRFSSSVKVGSLST